MTPAGFTVLRKSLGLSQDELAALMGRDRRAIMSVENGDGLVPPLYALAIERLSLGAAVAKQDLNLPPASVRNDALAYHAILRGEPPETLIASRRTLAMHDGLYIAEFHGPHGSGTGTASLVNGRIRGGDGAMYYSGHYAWEGEDFSATVNVNKYAGGAEVSIFGLDSFTLTISGAGKGDIAEFVACTPAAPRLKMHGSLKRVAD